MRFKPFVFVLVGFFLFTTHLSVVSKQSFLKFFSVLVARELPKAPKGFVLDESKVLTLDQLNRINAISSQLKFQTKIDFVLVFLDDLDGELIEDVAVNLFEAWGLGDQRENTGLLFLIATQEKKVRIEVGYGLEGVFPDAKLGIILDEAVLPYFVTGNIKAGALSGYQRLLSELAQDYSFSLDGLAIQAYQVNRLNPNYNVASWGGVVLLTIIALLLPFKLGRRFLYMILIVSVFRSRRYYSQPFGFFGGSGFSGFSGGLSGGGGASRSW